MRGSGGTWSRRLVGVVVVLVVIDVVGGAIAIATDVNDGSEAWGPEARLAAPWQMIVFQIALAGLAVGRWRRLGTGAALLLAAACLISAISGFFDGGFAADELTGGHVAFQLLLIVWTALVGGVALVHAAKLATDRPARPASA